MHPSLDAIVIVPMFPHTLTSRPLVVSGQSEIRIALGASETRAHVSCDSQVDFALQAGDELRIRKSPEPLKLLYPTGHNFYDSCRSKLDWASRLGGR
jgi:NAD+ kinase